VPVHDWTRVSAGIFHDFRNAWLVEIRKAFNEGVLPPHYYALTEQFAGHLGPDVLPYRVGKTLVIRRSNDDSVVALVEIVSPGNKASRNALRAFAVRAAEALDRGYHLLILDLHPPGPREPQGIPGAVWEAICDKSYQASPDKPLTLVAYSAGPSAKAAYVQPFAVGDVLPDMPLFLTPEAYVGVPLEATYRAAWRGVPQRWRRVLEGPDA
jgi:hypothetical protein